MLDWLSIKNYAIVEETDIEFGENFNVITGETGAGKSVIVGTIGLLLGERADKSAIRTGASRCEISAGITLRKDVAANISEYLESAGIPENPGEQLQLKRIITQSNTRNFINDAPVTLQTLKSIGDCLIDIHGANEHQSLLKQAVQLELVDRYGRLDGDAGKCHELCEKIKDVQLERMDLEKNIPSKVEAEHLRMIAGEIEKVAPEPDEDKELSSRHSLAANSKQAIEIASKAVYLLNEGENSISDRLGDIYRDLQEIERIAPEKGAELLSSCDQIVQLARELAFDVENFAGNIELDEKEFLELEERLSAIQTLKRRYGPSLEQVFDVMEDTRKRLEQFKNSEEIRERFDLREKELGKKLEETANELTEKRKKASLKFAKEVKAELNKLGFLKCDFSVEFLQTEPGRNGADRIDFIFSANPGEKAQPLRNIASSGEMSRVMLALKTVLAGADSIPILLFDEIDVNIGGETASVVGEELKKLAGSHQVLCISHLAQVAASSDNHYRVEKSVSKGRTSTKITLLDKKARAQELGRMLGGTNGAMTHAKELLKK